MGSSPPWRSCSPESIQSYCGYKGKGFVIPDDIKTVAVDALSHRVLLDVEYVIEGEKPEKVIEDVLKTVEVPKNLTITTTI